MLAALCSAAVQAQTTAPAAAAPAAADDDEVVTLDAFTVSTARDVGYRATNSIAGTRTNTPIKDVPLNIQVFTKDLADDLLIKNQVQFETYNASLVAGGIDVLSDNHIQQPYQAFLFRGFVQNWGLRDGVREYDPVDTQSLQRTEVVKGPAAALYGLAYPGGIMQNISKAVDFSKNFTSLRFTGGVYGDYRATVDMNVHGTAMGNQKIGIRFNGAYEKTEDVREHSQGDVRLLNVMAAWQPTPTTKFEFMAEDGYRAKPNGIQGYFQTSEAGAVGNQASIPLQVIVPGIDWEWNWANDLNMNMLETKLYRGKVTQQIGEDFSIQAYMQYSRRLETTNQGWDASGSGGADAWENSGSGWDQATNTIRSTYAYRDWGNQMHAYGATAVYKLDFEQMKNTFAFGANVWKEDELSRRSAPTNPLASSIVYPVQMGIPINVPKFPPADLVPDMAGGWHSEDNSNDYYFVNWQASLFNDRLKTNIGVNKTNLKTVTWDNGNDHVANTYTASKNSPLFGATFEINKAISVFAVRSTSLFPDSTKDSFGNQFPPQVGLGYEGGVKVDLLDGKISGTISYFMIEQTGGTQNDPVKPNAQTAVFDSLTPAQQQIQFGGVRPLGDIVEGGTQESTGFEIDLTFQATRGWQILTSFSNVNHEFTESALPATIGQTFPQAIKNNLAVLTKYTFLEGELKGLAVGGGFRYYDDQLVDYQRRAPNGGVYSGTGAFIDVARYTPSKTVAELFATYRWRAWGQNLMLQLNAQNILETPNYVGWKATGNANTLATERYEAPTPIVWRVTFGLDF